MSSITGGMFFWLVVMPGVLYLFLTRRTQQLSSPGGWLLAAATGILIISPASLFWMFAKPQEFLGFLQGGKIDAVDLVRFGLVVYSTWFFWIVFYHLKQIDQRVGKL